MSRNGVFATFPDSREIFYISIDGGKCSVYSSVMKVESLLKVILAAHYGRFVEGPKALRRVHGGIMFIAPPASLKSHIIKAALDGHSGFLGLSDLNVQGLGRIRHQLANGDISTLGFYEFAKLYRREQSTSGSLESLLAALVDEGFHKLAFDAHEAHSVPAHALVLGAMVPQFYEHKMKTPVIDPSAGWAETGFARRFIWSVYRLDKKEVIARAIAKWQSITITQNIRFKIPLDDIPYSLSHTEAQRVQEFLQHNHGKETPSILLQKIACVLRWQNKQLKTKDDTFAVLEDFAESLQPTGASLTL